MSAYSHAGRHDEVLRLFRSLPFPPTAPLFTTLISSLAASGKAGAGFKGWVLRLFRSFPFPPTAPLFTTLISSLAASGNKSTVLDAFSPFASGLGPPLSLRCLSPSTLPHPSQSVYHAFFRTMAAMGCAPDAATYNCFIWMLYDSERWDEAWAILDIMLEEGVCPTIVRSYTAILSRARSSR
ncbi:hypothetical protein SORBI_3001G455200 [Sorghum bicolor]|nr:hypothetical protein SORBI_3001G455200 [Sorghum bicolor]